MPVPNNRTPLSIECSVVPSLVGVIDLAGGVAVHAVAGRRDEYQPATWRRPSVDTADRPCPTASRRLLSRRPTSRAVPPAGNPGDAAGLIAHYHRLGLRRLYVADLDSLAGRPRQIDRIADLIGAPEQASWLDEVLVDAGLTGRESDSELLQLRRLVDRFDAIRLVVASESVQTERWPDRIVPFIEPERIFLGLDFRDGQFVHRYGRGVDDFLSRGRIPAGLAAPARFAGVVVLDVGAVGTSAGPRAATACRNVAAILSRSGLPISPRIVSGGGVRSAKDVQAFLTAGCSEVLAATWLLHTPPGE